MTTATESAIQKAPGVVGGDARVRRTRIAVWMLVGYRKLGLTDAELSEAYPDLTPAAAWEYHAAHPAEIEAALRDNDGA